MTIQTYKSLVMNTLKQSTVSHDVEKGWNRRQSAHNWQYIRNSLKKIQDVVLKFQYVTIRQIIKHTGLSYHIIYLVLNYS